MNKLFIFAAGAIIGSVVTWKLVKTKYERIAQEEIDSVKEAFSRRTEIETDTENVDNTESEETIERKEEKPVDKGYNPSPEEMEKYEKILKEYKPCEGDGNMSSVHIDDSQDFNKPYVISPEEFGTMDDYETVSFDYYADGVVVDDFGDPVENVEEVIGDALNHFGEYEDDSVFVRDDDMKVDYEILADVRKWSDVVKGYNQ